MKKKFKSLIIIMMSVMMILGTSVIAFADEASIAAYVGQYSSTSAEIANLSKYLTTDSSSLGTSEFKTVFTSDSETYYYLTSDMSAIENKITQVTNASNVDTTISEISNNFNISPDFNYAYGTLSPILGAVKGFVGVMVVLITMLMTVNTAFDIAYIAFPMARNWMNDNKDSGGAMGKKNGDGSVSLRIVSDEAQYAVEQATTGGDNNGGKSAMTTYFKKRVINYIALAVMLFILLTGNISLITNLAVKVVSGILNILVNTTT
jgi:hypothetical protein